MIDIDWLPDFSQHKEWHFWLKKAKFNQTKAEPANSPKRRIAVQIHYWNIYVTSYLLVTG